MKTKKVKGIIVIVLLIIVSYGNAQSLKVTLLGTGAPVPSIGRFGPAILVEAGGQNFCLIVDVELHKGSGN